VHSTKPHSAVDHYPRQSGLGYRFTPRSAGGRNVRGEKAYARGQFFDTSPAHSGSMGHDVAQNWTAHRTPLPGRLLPPTLLDRCALSRPS
jgi:hypothetical protein